jgi:hypothetical protein
LRTGFDFETFGFAADFGFAALLFGFEPFGFAALLFGFGFAALLFGFAALLFGFGFAALLFGFAALLFGFGFATLPFALPLGLATLFVARRPFAIRLASALLTRRASGPNKLASEMLSELGRDRTLRSFAPIAGSMSRTTKGKLSSSPST